MALLLKAVLRRYGIAQREWAAAVRQKRHARSRGRPSGDTLSRGAASALLNHGRWPKTTPAAAIRADTERFLRARGIPEHICRAVWDEDDPRSAAISLAGSRLRRQPLRRMAGVFVLFRRGRPIYIGKSVNLLVRVHAKGSELGADAFDFISAPRSRLAALKARLRAGVSNP